MRTIKKLLLLFAKKIKFQEKSSGFTYLGLAAALAAWYNEHKRVRLFTDLTSGELAYGLVHKILTRKKHFISSDCPLSKGDIQLWQKDL